MRFLGWTMRRTAPRPIIFKEAGSLDLRGLRDLGADGLLVDHLRLFHLFGGVYVEKRVEHGSGKFGIGGIVLYGPSSDLARALA